jgi:ABC-2 type transport system permease protein
LLLTVCLSVMLLAAAIWLRRTVPLIMAWSTPFFLFRLLSVALVDQLHYSPRWRLIDLWNDAYIVGNWMLRVDPLLVRPAPQPPWYEGGLVLGGVSLVCLIYAILRIRAVEVVK